MHAHSAHATLVTPIPTPPPDLNLVMYRLDQVVAEQHKLRQEMTDGFADVRGEIRAIREDQQAFRESLHAQRHEFRESLNEHRHEFRESLNAQHKEFKEALQAQSAEFRREMDEMWRRVDARTDAMLDRVLGTVDDRIKLSRQESDIRLFKWCAGSAATSSAATSGLAYALSRFLS